MFDKKKSLTVLGTAVAFLVVMTVLILLVLKFQLFNFQDAQQPSESSGQVSTPENKEEEQTNNQEGENKPSGNDKENNKQPQQEKDEGGFSVGVDDTEIDPDNADHVISFEDLLNAAQKNEG